jgi:hypothetical protein
MRSAEKTSLLTRPAPADAVFDEVRATILADGYQWDPASTTTARIQRGRRETSGLGLAGTAAGPAAIARNRRGSRRIVGDVEQLLRTSGLA